MTDDPTATYYEQSQDLPAMPVHIASSDAEPTRPTAPEYGTAITFSVDTMAVLGKPVQLLSRRYRRFKAVISIPSLQQANGVPSSTTPSAVTSPGSSVNVSTAITPAPGQYIVNWEVELSGTLGAGDQDNFAVALGNTNLETSINDPVAGDYPQPSFILTVPVGNTATLKVRTKAAGTVGSIYSGTLTLTPVQSGGGIVVVSQNQTSLMQTVPVGFYVSQAPYTFQWENQKPCYATLIGTGPVQVSVLDQAYEEK